MEYMDDRASKNIEEVQDNVENQPINPATNPFSNGTGSGRSVFDPLAQDSINSVNQGQTMGNVMFNKNQQMDPTMQNQGPSLNIVSGGGAGGVGNLLTKLGPVAAATAGVVGVGKMIGGMGKKKKEKAKAASGASMRGKPDKKFKPDKGSNNLHVETSNFAAKAGMGQGNIRGDRAITFDNIENVTTDNTYVKRFQKPIMAKKK